MGSGLYLNHAQEKYGLDNFTKEILFECSSEEEMNDKERELVNEDFVRRKNLTKIEKKSIISINQCMKNTRFMDGNM